MNKTPISVLAICALTSANAATFTVTNLNDSGAGSLRQAIVDANGSAGDDVIEFAVSGTITLTSGQLSITDDLSINGPGSGSLNVFGVIGPDRVFEISSSANVEMNDLTISGGADGDRISLGAGIFNFGVLTLNDTILEGAGATAGDDGGGIYNTGTLTLNNSSITGYTAGIGGGMVNARGVVAINNSIVIGSAGNDAGGIKNGGTMTITNSTVSGGGEGPGGIDNSGTMTLVNSTVSGSFAAVAAGGIGNTGTLTLINSTVSNNRSGECAGICNWESGALTLINSTVSENQSCGGGSGIDNESQATVTISNSIVAGNTPDEDCDRNVGDVLGAFVSLGHNLIGISDSSTGFGATGDQLGTVAAPLDPLLGPLQNNGGPTETHALLEFSPAIDAGSNTLIPAGVTTDQRGFARIVNGTVDIGAFERGDDRVVEIDVKPYSDKNRIWLSSLGLVRVAILGSVSFDVLQVDIPTVQFGPDGARAVRWLTRVRDVNHDGFTDLILRFKIRRTGIQCGDRDVTLTGVDVFGQAFSGTDSIRTKGCR